MSHSTQIGFTIPPRRSGGPAAATTSSRFGPKSRSRRLAATCWLGIPPPRPILANGVGNSTLADTASTKDPLLPFRRNRSAISGVGVTPMQASAVGVGHDEDSPSEMRRTNGGRRYAFPFAVVPERGQLSEYVAHPSNKQPWDVLHDDVGGS